MVAGNEVQPTFFNSLFQYHTYIGPILTFDANVCVPDLYWLFGTLFQLVVQDCHCASALMYFVRSRIRPAENSCCCASPGSICAMSGAWPAATLVLIFSTM